MPSRRALIAALPLLSVIRPAGATPEAMQAAIREVFGDRPIARGRIALDIPPLVENGNTVPLSIVVDSPMTAAEHVRRIGVFNSRNPLPGVILAELGPRAGAARMATRLRLATSQQIMAVAEMADGSLWSETAEIVVTLAACVEG
jgi:sulfur-oxidizing protein SoxY